MSHDRHCAVCGKPVGDDAIREYFGDNRSIAVHVECFTIAPATYHAKQRAEWVRSDPVDTDFRVPTSRPLSAVR